MKQLSNYITEKFKISSKTVSKQYTCQPKDKFELRKILEERLKEDKDADLNDIDVSQITDMSYEGFPKNKGLFEGLDPHNIDISKWDISNVTNIHSMFYECQNFNSDLSKWDVSNVKETRTVFYGCKNFNSDLSKWDVSNVKDMSGMFNGCKKFNYNLSNWDVSNVKYMDYMFDECDSLKNKPSWYKK